ncbi:MAG TPA: DUF6157 family protein [Myxococcota bacterium]
MHTTNTPNTFIVVAPDSTAEAGVEPKAPKEGTSASIARRTWEIISAAPYTHTSDDVIFSVWADRQDLPTAERPAARATFFAKGQPCLRASDLTKKYGWGVHHDDKGRVALFPVGSVEYEAFAAGKDDVTVVKAMRSKRA